MEPILAGVVLLLCAAALLRLAVGARRRARIDALLRRAWLGLRVRALTLWRWRRLKREADQAARDAIRRASGRDASAGDWEGNVYRPKSFRKPRKPH